MHAILPALLVAAATGTSGPAVPPAAADSSSAPVPSFLELARGGELRIRYHSFDCYSGAIYDLTFRRDPALSVTVVLVRSWPAGVHTPRPLATVAVSDSAAEDLDALMRLYRAGPVHPSNGGLRLDVTQIQNGMVVASETFSNTPVIRRLGSYGFSALIDQARKAAPPEATIGEFR
jgi:hypothetical protein